MLHERHGDGSGAQGHAVKILRRIPVASKAAVVLQAVLSGLLLKEEATAMAITYREIAIQEMLAAGLPTS
jgi:hypothetical protein